MDGIWVNPGESVEYGIAWGRYVPAGLALILIVTGLSHIILRVSSKPGILKPVEVKRTPPVVAPHQPRLDWQMWFAALSSFQRNQWLLRFSVRLLQGSPQVIGLLAGNPFPDHPPKYVRAELYDYRFTTADERARTGAWWHREELGLYMPPISLR